MQSSRKPVRQTHCYANILLHDKTDPSLSAVQSMSGQQQACWRLDCSQTFVEAGNAMRWFGATQQQLKVSLSHSRG